MPSMDEFLLLFTGKGVPVKKNSIGLQWGGKGGRRAGGEFNDNILKGTGGSDYHAWKIDTNGKIFNDYQVIRSKKPGQARCPG
jgi:hypothetical protein